MAGGKTFSSGFNSKTERHFVSKKRSQQIRKESGWQNIKPISKFNEAVHPC